MCFFNIQTTKYIKNNSFPNFAPNRFPPHWSVPKVSRLEIITVCSIGLSLVFKWIANCFDLHILQANEIGSGPVGPISIWDQSLVNHLNGQMRQLTVMVFISIWNEKERLACCLLLIASARGRCYHMAGRIGIVNNKFYIFLHRKKLNYQMIFCKHWITITFYLLSILSPSPERNMLGMSGPK